MELLIVFLVGLCLVFLAVKLELFRRSMIIYDGSCGLLYRKGQYLKTLGPGRYRYHGKKEQIVIWNLRRQSSILSGQEIFTKDPVSVRVSAVCFYVIKDAHKTSQSDHYVTEMHAQFQIAMRELVGQMTLDELLTVREEFGQRMLAIVAPKLDAMGIECQEVALRDIMLPGNLKHAYAGVIEAQKNAQRQLEKARGEQAVLRSLANSAKMFESNPGLLQMRLIQSLSEAGGGNKLVLTVEEPKAAS